MTKFKIKNQSIFWISVFSILVQVWGKTENTATSSCGGVLELSSGALDFSTVDQNRQNPQDFCIWVIKLPANSETIQFELTQIPQSSQLNLFSQEGHVAGQISILPIASLTTADINNSIDTNSSNLVVIWTPSRVENEEDESSGLLSFKWDEVSDYNEGQGQRSGQVEGSVDRIKDMNLNLVGGVNYVEADRGRFSWAKPGKRQQTLLWVLNSGTSKPLDLKIETNLENCDLIDPCLCSYFGVYEVRDNFLRAVSRECGRSSDLKVSGVQPRLVALGFVNPDFRADMNHVTLSWNAEEPEESTTTTSTSTTTTTTEPPKTCSSGFPESCSKIPFEFGSTGNSSQLESCLIYPDGPDGNSLQVLCDFETDVDDEGAGWTVIQKRSSGPREEFNRTWNEYQNGFGSLDGNFWIGLDNIRALAKKGDQELRIELEDFEGAKVYAKYSSFLISDAFDFYRLLVGGFSGDSTAGDSMTTARWGSGHINNGMRFSTPDMDNDVYPGGNCAAGDGGGGGWWFNNCGHVSNLNGPYGQKGETGNSMFWISWKNAYNYLAKTEMKIRKRKSQ